MTPLDYPAVLAIGNSQTVIAAVVGLLLVYVLFRVMKAVIGLSLKLFIVLLLIGAVVGLAFLLK